MGDSRNMTFGLDFGLDTAIGELNNIVAQLESTISRLGTMETGAANAGEALRQAGSTGSRAVEGMANGVEDATGTLESFTEETRAAGHASGEFGQGVRNAGDTAGDGLEEAGRAASTLSQHFLNMGAQAENFGAAFGSTMGEALEETGSFAKGFRAGVQGAFGYAAKQAGTFSKKAKEMGSAFLHPIKTIKGKLVDALKSAGNAVDDTGDSADKAKKDLGEAGDTGAKAGDAIKEAFKGAIGAMIGIEAIKSGIDMLKNFVGMAIGAAGQVENVGAKFDAVFKDSDVGAWADNFSDAVHRSKSEVEGFLVSNKALYQNLGVTGEAADELSKVTTSLAYDFGNAFKMEDAEALSVMQDAIGGNVEALSEYGFKLDETALQEQARKMGIHGSLEDLDEATLAQIRMNEILEQSGSIQQAAIKDTGGLVNSTKSLKGIFTDFMASAGAKFVPAIEKLFGAVLDNWPVIEPMLMGFVSVLSSGLEQAVPVLMELGQTLIPVLTSVLGTLLQAAMPLLSTLGGLAQTVLPPLAGILGMLGETLLPPLISILDTLNTSIIQPLMPVLQRIVASLMPPLAQLLATISPILQLISPLLVIIGDALAWVAEILGNVIGWLADGVGKVTDFFGSLFGGAKESKDEVHELGGAMGELGNITASPSIEIATPTIPDIKIPDMAVSNVTVPVSTGGMPTVAMPQMQPLHIPVEPLELPEIGELDTKTYIASIDNANTGILKNSTKTWEDVLNSTDSTLKEVGAASDETFNTMAEQSESMWKRMVTAAETGAEKIIQAFKNIGSAALGLSGANLTVAGPNIPHNADGTNDFAGGWTHINEEGGEMAFLPQGTAILPADETREILGNAITQESVVQAALPPVVEQKKPSMPDVKIEIPINIKVEGNADDSVILRLMEEIKKWLEIVVDTKVKAILESLYEELSNQHSLV